MIRFNCGGVVNAMAFGWSVAFMFYDAVKGFVGFFMVMTVLAAINLVLMFTAGRE